MDLAVRTFLVECYAPGIAEAAVREAGERAQRAVAAAAGAGETLEYLGALFVSGDEAAYHAFRAMDAARVETVSRAAGLGFTRIVESVSVLQDGWSDTLEGLLDVGGDPAVGPA